MRINKKAAAVAVAAVAIAGTGVAYAYWTTTGSGEGTATNASENGTIVLTASWADDALYPGGDEVVTVNAANAADTTLYVGTVHLESVEVDAGHSGCDVGDFTMDDFVANQAIETGNEDLAVTGLLEFANDSDNSQDDCKGADITLNLSSN